MEFYEWKRDVEKLTLKAFGLQLDELPDEDYRNHHLDDLTPEDMFAIILDGIPIELGGKQ